MENRLFHIHLHDNDGTGDTHWPIGRGTIDFESFYASIMQHVPNATISLEVEDKMEVKMGDLRKLVAHFTSKQDSKRAA
jgi:sugar phosphate isomerase/epimerase